jgi:hypothetical protein
MMKNSYLRLTTLIYRMASYGRQQASALWSPFGSAPLPFRHCLKPKTKASYKTFSFLLSYASFANCAQGHKYLCKTLEPSRVKSLKIKSTSVPSDKETFLTAHFGSKLTSASLAFSKISTKDEKHKRQKALQCLQPDMLFKRPLRSILTSASLRSAR